MTEIIQLPATHRAAVPPVECAGPAVRTDNVYVVFTSTEETIAALRIGDVLAKAMAVPLTLVHFRSVPYQRAGDAPVGLSPVECDEFCARLRAEGLDVRVRVILRRDERQTIRLAFKPHSLIVIGGHASWWPTLSERRRRALEAAGHFVVFVDRQEQAHRRA